MVSPDNRIEEIAEEYLDQLQRGEAADIEAMVSAHPDIAEALELADDTPGIHEDARIRLSGDHAAAQVLLGNTEDAEAPLHAALDQWDSDPLPDSRSADRILRALVNLYESGGDAERASEYRRRLEIGR